MFNTDLGRRWRLVLVIIVIVLVASITIITIRWPSYYPPNVHGSVLWGWFLGLPLGLLVGYLWSLLVLFLAFRFLPWTRASRSGDQSTVRGKRSTYAFLIALLGIPIGWAHIASVWKMEFDSDLLLAPALRMATLPEQAGLIVVFLLMVFLLNFTLAYAHLKLEQGQAFILGSIMALFIAPWLLPTVGYLLG